MDWIAVASHPLVGNAFECCILLVLVALWFRVGAIRNEQLHLRAIQAGHRERLQVLEAKVGIRPAATQ